MRRYPKPKPTNGELIPDIGTAWLVLSHGAWFGAEIAAVSVSLNESAGKNIAIMWAAISIAICLWTFYAIETTRKASSQMKSTIFGSEAFIMLNLLNLITLGGSISSLIALAIS